MNIAGPAGYNSPRPDGRQRMSQDVALEQERTASRSADASGGGGEPLRKAGVLLAGLGVFALVLVLYLKTLAPTVLYLQDPELLDAVMLQMQVSVLGIAHPTGYPTYLMLTHLFTHLPFGDPAYRVNLGSAFYAALAVVAVYAAGLLLGRRIVAAATGALVFGLGTALWSQAVIAEVYTLNALLVSLTIVVLLLWREYRQDRYLLLSAFLVGLCLTNHLTSGLLLPAGLLLVALVDWRRLVDFRLVLGGAGLFVLGLIPYLYLPIRAAMDPPMEANNPTDFGRFWYVISGGNLTGSFFSFGPSELPGRMVFYWEHLLDNMPFLVVMVALPGAVVLLLRDRAVGIFLGFLFFGWLFHAVENDIPDIDLYFIPTYLVLSLWAAAGIGTLLAEVETLVSVSPRVSKGAILGVLSAMLLVLPLLGVSETYAKNDMSGVYRGRQEIEAVADNAAPNATILHHRSGMWYMVLVEKRRRDLTIVDPFYHNKEVAYADIVWPDDIDLATTDRRYGTDDLSGVSTAKKAAKEGRVYVLDQASTNPERFRNAGFEVVRVRSGLLYELVPPGREPYAG
jgi:Protein O-mannosyl-transferase TMEM260-like